ncbi:hypothetical protein GCM10011512_03990 [Tersicoccus solisilvae]|uniref:Methyltransferase domain-containing protein n=1 Tax=Tersicoccus solisilvae TaxID=1882339 RepID=A0ABQ1NLZ8_9MICC|nr:methyltransferase domain-containing protein [Tersicoccus solisilvae]GGC80435.1 hypothetical protein GCM10011512_03990 [Tersicoccus solisilvae]
MSGPRDAAAPPRYTHGHHESVLRSHRWRTAANSAGYLLPHLVPGMRVLDVGCGPGTITRDLAERVAPGEVIGLDSAADVLDVAAAGPGPANVRWRLGDVHALPFTDAGFDVVHAHQVLQHLADPVGALTAMRRVLRPGGLLAVRDADYQAMSWFPQVPELDEWMSLYQRVARLNGGEPDAGRRLPGWLHQAGLTDVTVTASTWCYTGDERRWWAELWSERITRSAFADQAVRRGLASHLYLERLAQGWRQWAESADAVFLVPSVEVLALDAGAGR